MLPVVISLVLAMLTLADAFEADDPFHVGRKRLPPAVAVEAKADKPDTDGNQLVTVTLRIRERHYLFAPLHLQPKDFPPRPDVTVAVDAGEKPLSAKVEYPLGRKISDNIVGDYYIYEGTVTIKAHIVRVKGDTSPLNVVVEYMPFDAAGCRFPRETVKRSVP